MNPTTPRPDDPATSTIDFHRGDVIAHLSDTYSRLPQTLLECVQNGFDAGADRIIVCIDLHMRMVIIYDNGSGTDRKKFEEALASVGHSVKDKTSLGRFGLGLISPLSKCTSFTFTSSSGSQRKALRWTFRLEDIRQQKERLEIPCTPVPGVPRLPKRFIEFASGEFDTVYRTQVQMFGVTQDRVKSLIDLDDLAYNIRTKFAIPMRQRKAVVRLVMIDTNKRVTSQDVSPQEYTGERLPVVSYDNEDTGSVEFELYRARVSGGKRRGEVSVMASGDNYPITIREFVAQARRKGVGDVLTDAMKGLSSGNFEGIIRCQNIKLAPNRKSFVYDDALEMLYLVVDQWWDEYGHTQYATEEDLTRHSRWQELGLKSQDWLHELLHLPEYAPLWDALRDVVSLGRLGSNHLEPETGKPDGTDSDGTLRVGQGGVGQARTPRPPVPPSERQREPKERPGDTPLTVTGPSGSKRRLVSDNSKGLNLAHAELPGDSRLWDFDFQDGTLTFNTLHPVWVRLDETNGRHLVKNAKWIMHLQEWLTLEVLHLLMHYPDAEEFDRRRDFIDDQIKHYADLFIIASPRR